VKTQAVTPADLSASVLAVPPLARTPDLGLDRGANAALIGHIESGGISTLLYGGNANLYHVGAGEYEALLDLLEQTAAPRTWVIPSVGPDFGKMLDQAAILRRRAFPTAMVLPQTFPLTTAGVETGLRRFADAFGRPIVVYIKADGYLTPEGVRRLVDAGIVAGIKYAVVREDPRQDPFLSQLVELVDRRLIVSGIGERPAIVHLRDFGLAGFTTGSGCVGPRGSTTLLAALRAKDYARAEEVRAAFIPLEDLRDAHSPIRVLHEAVRLAGIADTGPMLPLLSNLDAEHHPAVKQAALALLAADRALPQPAAAS
jgi:dihydrodipicolinate synthase/N-acetylneuraminate lyase